MSSSWLYGELATKSDAEVVFGDPVFSVTFAGRTERVYCPNADEYAVTGDVVKKAHDNGATIISYASNWCQVNYEAKRYGKELGITVMAHAEFFAYLKRKGVHFNRA